MCTCVDACAYAWIHVHMWGAQADLVLEDTGFPVDGCGVLEPCRAALVFRRAKHIPMFSLSSA